MPIPEIRRVGDHRWSRFVIASGPLYWSGVGWTDFAPAARLYLDKIAAEHACQRLVAPSVYRLFVPVTIRVNGKTEFTAKELRDFLVQYAVVAIQHDTGEIEAEVDWDGAIDVTE